MKETTVIAEEMNIHEQEKMDWRFQEFVSLVKKHINDLLVENFWEVTDLQLINNDYNFTNRVFRYRSWWKKYVVKTNLWDRSIWSNFRVYLEDKEKFNTLLKENKCTDIISKQYEDYKKLNALWISTIDDTQVQLIDNLLITPYIEWKDLWTFISEWHQDIDSSELFVSLKKLIDSLDELYKTGLIYWDLKMDNLFISWNEVMLLDPQIKEWNEDEDIWKLIFSILLLCHHLWDIYWYDEFRKFFLETLWYSKEKLKEYRRSWYDIYKFLVSLHYPKNSKEVAMMHDFYNRMQRLYQWSNSYTQHKKDM
jgi:hypothetical protein